MDTSLLPLNVAQFQNTLSFIGEWATPYFSALLPLAAISVAITIVVAVMLFIPRLISQMMDFISEINIFHIRNRYDIQNDYNVSGGMGFRNQIPERPKARYKTDSGKVIYH